MLARTRAPRSTSTVGIAVAGAAAAMVLTGGSIAAADAPAPTSAELQGTLDRFADPGVPTAAKTNLVVDGNRHSANIDQMNKGLANYGKVGFTVSNVQAKGDDATAQVAVVSPHGTMPGVPMSWQHTAAGWQLSEKTGCTILAMAMAPC
ncbi:hypothetical protein ABIA39_005487 [Nocardia sp. GAS34]|uniref:hypothetical protein n=1 Tax=unclassified Nocardia TaxID=2637762 RepID=UPI003D23FC45